MHKILRLAEYGFTVFSLVLYTDAVLLLILSGGAGEEVTEVTYDTTLRTLLFIAVYLVTFALLAYRWKQALYTLTQTPLAFVLIGVATGSVLWSWSPDYTLKQSAALIGSSIFGLYLATRYSLKQQLYLLGWMFGIVVILSFLFAILLPQYGVMGGIHAGAWRGVFVHKNGLGGRMIQSVTIFSILTFNVRRNRWLPVVGVLLSVMLLLLSRSTSALVNTLFILVALSIFQVIRWRSYSRLLALTLLAFAAETLVILLLTYAETFANFLGKDITLTGRTELWQATWEMIQRHPWFGYGYDGFWHGIKSPSAYIWRATGWKMNHPHNGFLALWIDLGILGLAIFLMSFLRSFYRSLNLLQLTRDATAFLPLSHLVFLIIANLTESSLLFSNFMPWVLYVSLSASVAKELNRRNRMPKLQIQNSSNLQRVYSDA